ELRRDDMDVEDGHVKPNIGGTHDDGVVTVFDDGAQVIGTGYRHGGDARELPSPYICSLCGAQIAILDMVITHEMGHDFHDQRPEIFKAYQKAAGWQSLEKSDISAAGLGDEDIEKLELTRKEPYAARNQVHKHGKIYMVDPYEKKKYLVVDETAIPTGAESEPASGGGDSWNYARSNYKDAFAEHYAKAVHVPQKLYKDLIETPASLVVSKQAIFDLSDQALKALDPTRNTPAEYAQAQRDLRSAQAELATAKKAQAQRKEEFDIMRDQVFGTDTEEAAAERRLAARGISEEKRAAFLAESAKASTPEQVKVLEGNVR